MIRVAIIVALAATGCLLKPDKIELSDGRAGDGAGDGGLPTFRPRVIDIAYYDPGTAATDGMTDLAYSVRTTGISEGDLVLFIANVDNGSDGVFPPPVGFTQMWQRFYAGDQTYVAMWKIATATEPGNYTSTYGAGHGSCAAVIALLAISGAKHAQPAYSAINSTVASAPVDATSPGITTQAPGSIIIYAAGANWSPSTGTCMFTHPPGFMPIVAMGDKGSAMFEWTTELVAWQVQAAVGNSGPLVGALRDIENDRAGEPWTITLAIAPE